MRQRVTPRHSNGLVAAGVVGFIALVAAYPMYIATKQSKVGWCLAVGRGLVGLRVDGY